MPPCKPSRSTYDAASRAQYGSRLRAARTALGLTQASVADRLGVARQYVSDLERGRRLEAWPAWLTMVQLLGYDVAIVAPELVDSRPLVSRNQVSSTDFPLAGKKTDLVDSQQDRAQS